MHHLFNIQYLKNKRNLEYADTILFSLCDSGEPIECIINPYRNLTPGSLHEELKKDVRNTTYKVTITPTTKENFLKYGRGNDYYFSDIQKRILLLNPQYEIKRDTL